MPLSNDASIRNRKTERLVVLRVAADTIIYMGAIVAVDANGWAVPASDTAGYQVIGVAQERADNLGGGDGNVLVRVQKGVFALPNSSVNPLGQQHVGRPAHIEDDYIVAHTSTNNQIAGVVDEIGPNGRVYVYFA